MTRIRCALLSVSMLSDLEIRPIRSDADLDAALAQIERLWDAPEGSPEEGVLDALARLVEAYEDEHYPIGMPTLIGTLRFRLEPENTVPYARVHRQRLATYFKSEHASRISCFDTCFEISRCRGTDSGAFVRVFSYSVCVLLLRESAPLRTRRCA